MIDARGLTGGPTRTGRELSAPGVLVVGERALRTVGTGQGSATHEPVGDVHEALARLGRSRFGSIVVSPDALRDRPRAALRALVERAHGARVTVLAAEKDRRAATAARALGIDVVSDAVPAPTRTARRERMPAPAPAPASPPTALPRADRPVPARPPLDAARFTAGCLSRIRRPRTLERFVLGAFAKGSGATRASLLVKERGRKGLRLRNAVGLPEALLGQVRCTLGSGIAGRAAMLGRPVLGYGSSGGPRAYDATAYVVLPFGRGSRCEGVVCLSGLPDDALPPEPAVRDWRRLATQAASAFKSARRLERAEALSSRDRLTGLANRRAFERALSRELSRAERAPEQPGLGVALLDLDRFKSLNDRYGHQAGDRVLQQVARRLDTALRDTDLVARWGGEEFAVLIPGLVRDRPEEALAVIERARRALSLVPLPLGPGLPSVRVTLSGGLARYPEDGIEASALIRNADLRLYRAKAAGRDRVEGP